LSASVYVARAAFALLYAASQLLLRAIYKELGLEQQFASTLYH
jgi:hypothetical protein